MQHNENSKFDRLREKAEELLTTTPALDDQFTRKEFNRMIHDLQVHQIELELQNEDLMHAQQQLEESRNRYALLFNQAPVGFITIDIHSIIIQCNETFARMTGRNVADITGKSLGEFFSPADRMVFLGRFNAFFKAPAGKSMELTIEPWHAKPFPVRLTGRFEDGTEGNTDQAGHKLLLIIHDITAEKEHEQALRLSQEELRQIIAVKDKFFSIIAHDLRGPFTSLLGYTEMMTRDDESLTLKELKQFAGSMRRTAVNLHNLLENLLEWARIQQGSIPCDPVRAGIEEIVRHAVESVRTEADQKELLLSVSCDGHAYILADRLMIETAIRNTLINAIKFTPRGGSVTVEAKRVGDQVQVVIRDTGIGMSEETLSRLFRPDVKLKTMGTEGEPGTGLGLILCREYVEKNGGKITVASVKDTGSTVGIILPAVAAGS